MLGRRRGSHPGSALSHLVSLGALLAIVAAVIGMTGVASARRATAHAGGAFPTATDYVLRFYPRWFTYRQDLHLPPNRFFAPARISPIYHEVVAINDDTLYASSFMNLAKEPAVLTVPKTRVTYSLLTLDAYGEIFKTTIPVGESGTYLLTGPGWSGTVPAGMTQVSVPESYSQWIFRSDKFSGGIDTTGQARLFRRTLRVLPLAKYQSEPTGGATRVVPEAFFSTPYKGIADRQARKAPIRLLVQLQEAMHAASTPQLSAADQRLSDRFDALFGEGGTAAGPLRSTFERAVRSAHAAILAHYLSHKVGNNWINFTNIGKWGRRYLDRDAITEYIQYGNNFSTAAYFHAFEDAAGTPLNGRGDHVYVLHLNKGDIPQAKRFWSLTAYVPGAIELVPNSANKYEVASYDPALQTSPDGSISIYISATRPPNVPTANWLPVPKGAFNVMLRVYGPEGTVAEGKYVPPAIISDR